jgi:hypothetical protein
MTATATGQEQTFTQQFSTSRKNKSADHTGIHAQAAKLPIINGLAEHRQDPTINLVQLISATGQLQEATQQASNPCNQTPADHTGIYAQAAKLPIINGHDKHRQESTVNLVQLLLATGQLQEATQQASNPRNQKPADRTGIHAQAEIFPIINGHDKHRQEPTIDLVHPIPVTGHSKEPPNQPLYNVKQHQQTPFPPWNSHPRVSVISSQLIPLQTCRQLIRSTPKTIIQMILRWYS